MHSSTPSSPICDRNLNLKQDIYEQEQISAHHDTAPTVSESLSMDSISIKSQQHQHTFVNSSSPTPTLSLSSINSYMRVPYSAPPKPTNNTLNLQDHNVYPDTTNTKINTNISINEYEKEKHRRSLSNPNPLSSWDYPYDVRSLPNTPNPDRCGCWTPDLDLPDSGSCTQDPAIIETRLSLPMLATTDKSVILGVQHLERQQAEQEAMRSLQSMSPTDTLSPYSPVHHPFSFDQQSTNAVSPTETEQRVSSSKIPSSIDNNPDKNSSFARYFLAPMRQRRTDGLDSPQAQAASTSSSLTKGLVYGYLHKLTRKGVWQRRFFETDGMWLTYYKSQKRASILAMLDLIKVGAIKIDKQDLTGCSFTIQVGGSPYYLRSDDAETCKDWVINLNRVREARGQVGGIKLVTAHHSPVRKRTESSTEYAAAKIVIVANRKRSHAIDDESDVLKPIEINTQDRNIIRVDSGASTEEIIRTIGKENLSPRGTTVQGLFPDTDHELGESDHSPCGSTCSAPAGLGADSFDPEFDDRVQTILRRSYKLSKDGSESELYATWQKRRTSYYEVMRNKLGRLFRWTKKARCAGVEDGNVITGIQSVHGYHTAVPTVSTSETTEFRGTSLTFKNPHFMKTRSFNDDDLREKEKLRQHVIRVSSPKKVPTPTNNDAYLETANSTRAIS